jgi:hypothetical protein
VTGMTFSMQPADQSHVIPFRGGEPLTRDQLRQLVHAGGRCVRYEFIVSALVATFRFQSGVYLTDSWQERYLLGLPFSVMSLLLGPWGVPWGPILTARAVWVNLSGGVDMTAQVAAHLGESGADLR